KAEEFKVNYIETSAKKNINVDLIFSDISKKIMTRV
ncbi:MAG: hypothetical protein KAX33_05925, partial [Candidatus Lokiarchaeota archaeon]|nr:hypothetical protein [Candidatus Lokiarchaeota archaeon]